MSGDGLRDEIARRIHDHACSGDPEAGCAWFQDGGERCDLSAFLGFADAVLPVVQARVDAAREQVAEQIAQAIDGRAKNSNVTAGLVYGTAARIAREYAKGDGDE